MKSKIIKISAFVFAIAAIVAVITHNSSYAMTSGGDVPALQGFTFTSNEVTSNDKLYYNLSYEKRENAELGFISLILENIETGYAYYLSSDNLEYFDLSKSMEYIFPGQYRAYMLSLFPKDYSVYSDNAYYYNRVEPTTEEEMRSNIYAMNFSDQIITIKDSSSTEMQTTEMENVEKSINITTETATIGERVNLTIARALENASDKYESFLLSFTNINDGNVLNVYVKSLDTNPYFIIPSNTSIGTYSLDYCYITFQSGYKAIYKNDGNLAYNDKFNVVEKQFDSTKYVFNNEDYNDSVKNDINKLDENAIITINANKNSLISKEIFEQIKDTSRSLFIEYGLSQWLFNGKDIKNPKSIDVSTVVEDLKTSEYYNSFLKKNTVNNSALLNFSENGELPGKVLIRLESEKLNNIIKSDEAFIYYYKEDSDNLQKIALEVQKNNGFYEFYITHNSKYIITPKKLTSKAVTSDKKMLAENNSTENNDEVTNKNSNNIIKYSIAGVSIIALIFITVFITLKISKKNNKKVEIKESKKEVL